MHHLTPHHHLGHLAPVHAQEYNLALHIQHQGVNLQPLTRLKYSSLLKSCNYGAPKLASRQYLFCAADLYRSKRLEKHHLTIEQLKSPRNALPRPFAEMSAKPKHHGHCLTHRIRT